VREHNESQLEMDVTVDGATQHSSEPSVETIDYRSEVLAVGGDGAPTRVKVAYAANHKQSPGKGVVASPVEGKAYVVEGNGAKVPTSIVDANGKPASAGEVEVIGRDFKYLGRVDPSWRALPEQLPAIGTPSDALGKALMLDGASEGLESAQVRFAGTRDVPEGPAATFAVEMTGKLFGETRTTIKGTVTVLLASGQEAESDASAPLEMAEKGNKDGKAFSIAAHGAIHFHKETTYSAR
jgi:hypothetical protein